MGRSMTQATTQSAQAILQLLAAAGPPPPPPEETGVTDYDWNSPCGFTSSQIERLQYLVGSVSGEMSAALRARINDDVELKPGPLTQCYAEQLLSKENDTKKYYVSLASESSAMCGFVMVSAELANQWVAKVLGGASTEAKDLSSLESTILIDIVESLMVAFNRQFQSAGGLEFRCEKDVSSSPNLPPDASVEEYTILSFRTSEDSDQDEVQLILTSGVLTPVVNAGGKPTSSKSPEQIQKDIVACIEQVNIKADVILGKGKFTLREIMSLENGDVLLMDTEIGQRTALTVNDVKILYGYPVCCSGRNALQVTDWATSD